MLHLVIRAFTNSSDEYDVEFVTMPLDGPTIVELNNCQLAIMVAKHALPTTALTAVTVEWPPCHWWRYDAYAPAQDLLYPINQNWPPSDWLICELNTEHLAALAGISDGAEDADYPDARAKHLVYDADGDFRLEAKADNEFNDNDYPDLVSQWVKLADMLAAYASAQEARDFR